MTNLQESTLHFELSGAQVRLAALRRPGTKPAVLCLHGFGSTKEDYADLAFHPAFAGRGLALLDAPGFGESECDRPDLVSIPFLRDAAETAADRLGLEVFHLVGHSMGGLTALQLAARRPERVLSFANIEGNIAPEDCFLSRQIFEHPAETPQDFLQAFIERAKNRPEWSCRLYAAALPRKVRAEFVRPIFQSMVEISDNTPLMETFTGFAFPRMFVYGERNRSLSYLERLPGLGVELAEIPFSGHFPMYANPQALWARLADFFDTCDRGG